MMISHEYSPPPTKYELPQNTSKTYGSKVARFISPKEMKQRSEKIGRNKHCPCGSGKKHKKCCGKKYLYKKGLL